MNKDSEPKYPNLVNCQYGMSGMCAALGCQAQVLMNNSRDLGNNSEAKKRRDAIETASKAAGCPEELTRPF